MKLKTIDKWAAAVKATKLSDLGDAGADAVLVGVLTSGGAAGPAAAGIKVNGLSAKISPPASGTAGAITQISVTVAGTTKDFLVDEVVRIAKLQWRPCARARVTVPHGVGGCVYSENPCEYHSGS